MITKLLCLEATTATRVIAINTAPLIPKKMLLKLSRVARSMQINLPGLQTTQPMKALPNILLETGSMEALHSQKRSKFNYKPSEALNTITSPSSTQLPPMNPLTSTLIKAHH